MQYPNYPMSPSARYIPPQTYYPTSKPLYPPVLSTEPSSFSDSSKLMLALGALALGGVAAVLYKNRQQDFDNNHSELDSKPYAGPTLVIPKQFQDPHYCDQVAYRIGDEAFPKMMALLEQHPQPSAEFREGSRAIYKEAVKRHVAPNVSAGFGFSADKYGDQHGGITGTTSASWLDPDREKLEQEPVFYIGNMWLHGPDPFRRTNDDTLRKQYLQSWYETFVHETRHILQGYAEANQPRFPAPIELEKTDPLGKYGMDLLRIYDTAERSMYAALQWGNYPHSADISSENLDAASKEKLQGYWEDFQQLWMRDDFPLFSDAQKARYTKIFTHPEAKHSKLLEYHIKKHFIHELESYMVARKRMPGSTKEDVTPSDFRALARAMYLRDIMRLYYQVNHVPFEQQHPHAQITSLELIE